jgi:hypothetical protein
MGETKLKRDALIYDMRQQGWAYSIIGDEFGISGYRVQQICKSLRRHGLHEFKDYWELTTRTARCLKRMGLLTKRQIVNAVEDHRLYPKCFEGYGAKSHAEVLQVFNLPVPEEKPKLVKRPCRVLRPSEIYDAIKGIDRSCHNAEVIMAMAVQDRFMQVNNLKG